MKLRQLNENIFILRRSSKVAPKFPPAATATTPHPRSQLSAGPPPHTFGFYKSECSALYAVFTDSFLQFTLAGLKCNEWRQRRPHFCLAQAKVLGRLVLSVFEC